MDFADFEGAEGLRWVWNTWPTSRIDSARMVVPFGVVCNLLMPSADIPVVNYPPIRCRQCNSVLNPYCGVDYRSRMWNCPFCLGRNHFPTHYNDVNENNLPAELHPTISIVEYEYPKQVPRQVQYQGSQMAYAPVINTSPGFLFVVETCMSEQSLAALKLQLTHLLTLLPESARVGLISFGTMVNVHVLSQDCSKRIVFPGDKELPSQKIQDLLGLATRGNERRTASEPVRQASQYILPASECEFALIDAIEELQPNDFKQEEGHRPKRATGAALSVAAALMEGCFSMEGCLGSTGSRIMLFVSGPATYGPGIVLDTETDKMIRSHQNIVKGTAPHYASACKFYDQLGQRMVENGQVFDIFACSLDQVGAAEAKNAVQMTGGLMVLAETFESDQFKKSLSKLFEKDDKGNLKMAFNGTLEVMTTKDIKINGAIGPCSQIKRKDKAGSYNVSEIEIGAGGTNAWKLCTLNNKTAMTIFFEVVGQKKERLTEAATPFFIQFLTQYQHGNGQTRLRVTTVSRRWVDGNNEEELKASFDQECGAAVLAKLASFKAENEETFDVTRWLDKHLIQVSKKFGEFLPEDPSSFKFSSSFSLYPQFLYHLRRSQFLSVFNNSPDETAFFRLLLNREDVTNSVIMIQPTLLAYSISGPPVPVLLDVSSVRPDVILLFDSYFFVVVHYGSHIVQWRKAEYHKDPAYENFRALLEAPISDARGLMTDRVPEPKVIECDQYGSQARWLLAKLNPSATHNSDQAPSGDIIFTDDVSLEVFLDHLQRLAVQN